MKPGPARPCLNVSSYDVELDLTGPDESTFRSRTTVIFTCRKPGPSTFIEIASPKAAQRDAERARARSSATSTAAGSRSTDLAEANELVVDADCAYSRTGEGLHRFVDPVDGEVYLYTQFETYDAHRMYACFDQPDLKANFRLHVTAPEDWTCVSNGGRHAATTPGYGLMDASRRPRASRRTSPR